MWNPIDVVGLRNNVPSGESPSWRGEERSSSNGPGRRAHAVRGESPHPREPWTACGVSATLSLVP